MAVAGTIGFQFQFNDVRTIGNIPNANLGFNLAPSSTYANGTAALQVQVVAQFLRTFSGTTDTLNLTSGLADSYGTAMVLTAGKGFIFQNLSTTNTIVVGAGSNPITTVLNSTGTVTIQPGGAFMHMDPTAAGFAITASTACNFNVTGTNGQQYIFGVIGLGT
jgi:hypothetical protein